jgi:nucleoside-diphosphate-sugar epimerase
MKKILITGAGGFIAGHLVKKLKDTHEIIAIDKKPLNEWYQVFSDVDNIVGDLTDYDLACKVSEGVEEVYHLACEMGGIGFIEHNKTLCMLSIIPDVNMLKAAHKNNVKKFLFASTACIYPIYKQQTTYPEPLVEDSAYPADPEDGYGWEKLFMERMCRHFQEDFKIQTRVIRYHNVYGPHGTWDGGREKSPAALSRKLIEAIDNETFEIEIWGDGEQTRSFMYIDDAIEGTIRIMNSECSDPLNLGSDRMVSINAMVDILENISNVKLKRKYVSGPLGVRGRNSNNEKIKSVIGWDPSIPLEEGLKKTLEWIKGQYYESKILG